MDAGEITVLETMSCPVVSHHILVWTHFSLFFLGISLFGVLSQVGFSASLHRDSSSAILGGGKRTEAGLGRGTEQTQSDAVKSLFHRLPKAGRAQHSCSMAGPKAQPW